MKSKCLATATDRCLTTHNKILPEADAIHSEVVDRDSKYLDRCKSWALRPEALKLEG